MASTKGGKIIGGIGHTTHDILPWIIYGNAKDDTTTVGERFKGLIGK